jgi:peptide/bleomycin uptake transporter
MRGIIVVPLPCHIPNHKWLGSRTTNRSEVKILRSAPNRLRGIMRDPVNRCALPNAICSLPEYMAEFATFGKIAGLYVLIGVLIDFFNQALRLPLAHRDDEPLHRPLKVRDGHRRRLPARAERHHALRPHRGGSRRALGHDPDRIPADPVDAIRPSEGTPWTGHVSYPLVWVAVSFALAGTVLIAAIGIKLPGLPLPA